MILLAWGSNIILMKVLHVIRSIDSTTGGPAIAALQMASVLCARGVSVDIATTGPVRTDVLGGSAEPGVDLIGVRQFTFRSRGTGTWSFSRELWIWLNKNIRRYDLLHITGVFTFPPLIAARVAYRLGIPYIIRPAGTLDAYSLNQKMLKKRLYYKLLLSKIMDRASAIHATSEVERNYIIALGIRDRCNVVPLSVPVPQADPVFRESNSVLSILFLSRIHPKKGLPTVIQSVALMRNKGQNVRLRIAGDGSPAYLEEMKGLVHTMELDDVVDFLGQVSGENKSGVLADADLFVLPSYQENFGIAVVEAMAAGVPVVVSDQVAIAEEIARGDAGLVVAVDAPQELANAISSFLDVKDRRRVGNNGRKLVEQEFSAASQGRRLVELYESIAGPSAE